METREESRRELRKMTADDLLDRFQSLSIIRGVTKYPEMETVQRLNDVRHELLARMSD